MNSYNTSLTLNEALEIFYAKHNLGKEGGLNSNWAYLDMKWFRIPFPNTKSRKKALLFHDIHHIVTGYESNWQGEAEIAAWEVSSGCGEYGAAWFLDLGGIAMGIIFFPRKTFRAFIRGRRTKNFYLNPKPKEELMGMKIEEAQKVLGLNTYVTSPAKAEEIFSFLGWCSVAALWYIPFLILYAAIVWSVFL